MPAGKHGVCLNIFDIIHQMSIYLTSSEITDIIPSSPDHTQNIRTYMYGYTYIYIYIYKYTTMMNMSMMDATHTTKTMNDASTTNTIMMMITTTNITAADITTTNISTTNNGSLNLPHSKSSTESCAWHCTGGRS